jgi:shikimate dehydrogenase
MHNAALQSLNLPYVYVPFAVPPEHIEQVLRALPALGIRGVNCTIPHKEAALRTVDVRTPVAEAIGAVNTVIVEDGRLTGDNTDAYGFAAPLADLKFNLEGGNVLVLGAGGAARAVVYELLRQGAQVTLANRTRERAERLEDDMAKALGRTARCIPMDAGDKLREAVQSAKLLVNTTSVGMIHAGEGQIPIPAETLHPGLLVYDLVYSPSCTPLLAAASQIGCRTLNGLPMLVHQGARAFELWTGVAPPVSVMLEAAEQSLNGK